MAATIEKSSEAGGPGSATVTASARGAWLAVALWPVGILAGLIVMYIVAALLGVTIEPATGHTSMFNRIVILGITGLVWLVAPAIAVVRARQASNAGSRSGRVALVASTVLFLLTLGMTIGTIVDPGNML